MGVETGGLGRAARLGLSGYLLLGLTVYHRAYLRYNSISIKQGDDAKGESSS